MKREKLIIPVFILVLVLSAVCVAQVKREASPFEKYRQSTVNELEFRKLKFDAASIRASIQPTPLPNGLGAPFIEGETVEGKLLIEVEVHSSELPQTVDGRKDAMMEAVTAARKGFGYAFGGAAAIQYFDKWTVIQFSDDDKFLKAIRTKDTKPVDPYIGYYENGELVFR